MRVAVEEVRNEIIYPLYYQGFQREQPPDIVIRGKVIYNVALNHRSPHYEDQNCLGKNLEYFEDKNSDNLNQGAVQVYQDLSYGGILACRPGAWLVKKICFICMQSQFQKGPHIEIQNNFQNMFHFYDSFNGL